MASTMISVSGSPVRRGLRASAALIAFSTLTSALTGCATDCKDPRFDGAGCAVSDLWTGNYEKRSAELKQQATESQARAAALRAENDKLNAQMATLNREERAAARRLRNSNEKLAALITELSKARADGKKSEQELDRIDAQLKELEARHKAAGSGSMTPATVAEIQALEKDVQRLQKILEVG